MSHINFPLADESNIYARSQTFEKYLNKPANESSTGISKNISLALHGKLGGKIKFTLGLIYFFSLMYFTIRLFV